MLTPLPLHTQLVYSAYTESTPFPIPQGGEARKELTHSFLVTHRQDTLSAAVNTSTPSFFLFSLRCTYNNSLFVMLNFPKPLLPLFQGLPSGYRGWKNTHCYILYLRENNKTQSKEEEWDFYFYQKRGYQFKVEKKTSRLTPLQFLHYRWRNRLRRPRQQPVQGQTTDTKLKSRSVWLQNYL